MTDRLSTAPPRYGAGFWIGLAWGWTLIGCGIALLVLDGGAGRVRDVGLWVVGLDLAHDLLLAPLALLVALVVSRVVGPGLVRGPLLAGLGATAVVLLLAWPLLGRYGEHPSNPTVLPLNYPVAVATVLAVTWGLVLAAIAVRALRRLTTRPLRRADDSPAASPTRGVETERGLHR